MRGLLEKVSWKTRKLNLQFQLFTVYLHDQNGTWGFRFVTFNRKLRDHSLLGLEFRLPNKTTVKYITVDDWDFFFLGYRFWKIYDNLEDQRMWNPREMGRIDTLKLNILSKVFR